MQKNDIVTLTVEEICTIGQFGTKKNHLKLIIQLNLALFQNLDINLYQHFLKLKPLQNQKI